MFNYLRGIYLGQHQKDVARRIVKENLSFGLVLSISRIINTCTIGMLLFFSRELIYLKVINMLSFNILYYDDKPVSLVL